MSLESISILDIMNKDVKVSEQEQNIFEISKIMFNNNIGSVVIIDNYESKNPVGIVTERDIIRILSSILLVNLQVPIKELMSHPIITLSSKASVLDAMKTMYEQKIRRVIVLEENSIVGIVTEHDVFKLLMNNIDLITTAIDSNFYIPQHEYSEFSNFWFNNPSFK